MSMVGNYFRISSDRLKELQSPREALEEFLNFVQTQGYLEAAYKEQYFYLNLFWADLHIFLGRLRLPNSLWPDYDSSSGEIGTKIENFRFGVGPARFLVPNEVQAIANALRQVSEKAFMNIFRKNYPTRDEDYYEWALSTYLEWKEFLQQAAKEGQVVLFWIN